MVDRKSLIVPEGLPFIFVAWALCLIALFTGNNVLGGVLFVVAIFVTWFFRNPERNTPPYEKYVMSPADGKVIKIDKISNYDNLVGEFTKISIFMNVFNVHVNRIPYSGTVKKIIYSKGRFLSANLDKASIDNERNAVLIETETGDKILTIQIAGLIARRIVCWIREGMHVGKGERFGLIRFGSRLDVYLPSSFKILARIGDKVKAGESPIGEAP